MLALILACTNPPPAIDHVDTAAPFSLTGAGPALVVGLGTETHADAVPGQDAVIVFGGQGGFHVDVSGRARGVGVLAAIELSVEVGGVVIARQGDTPTFLRLSDGPTAEEAWFAGERAFLLDNSLVTVCGWNGVVATVCATATSLEDPAIGASDCVDVVLGMEPANLYMCG